ncbi:aldo/keto reductase [Jimgerdemannia flammicorona]|uniref:Aldo/keto reductase n=1 Tax=Jimgerdemannia flammicorona TaxID=994334 RepID=A0A433DA07_9FUNG|nr:aldo/keto reductase [Jimgerdemannia flammicorona]
MQKFKEEYMHVSFLHMTSRGLVCRKRTVRRECFSHIPSSTAPTQKMVIPHRELGRTGVKVAAIGLGCMGMSEYYGPTDDKESIAVLERSIELGSNFWDTADVYGIGKNEELLAKVLKTRRSEVFLATKFGGVRAPDGKFLGINGKPEYIRQALEASLNRLQVDYVDLYYQHRVDPSVPIEDTVRAMAELVKEGKVRYLGLSECSAATLRRAHAVHPIAALQIEYSPWTLDIEENGILETARELGKWRTTREALSCPENFSKNLDLVRQFEELAKAKGVASSQLILAWVLAQGQDFIPIPGTRRLKYLEENVGAANVTLSEHELKEIRKAIDSIKIYGTRYPEAGMKGLNI